MFRQKRGAFLFFDFHWRSTHSPDFLNKCFHVSSARRVYHLGTTLRGSDVPGCSSLFMPRNLKRYYGRGDLHFITFSCYRRRASLGTAKARNVFVDALREVCAKYRFARVGFVIMPEHVHLLIGEPKAGNPSTVIHSLKLRVSKRLRRKRRSVSSAQRAFAFPEAAESSAAQFWQRRFYDFNVYSARKRREKLEYMHRNPVTRRLVKDPKDWVWSSYSSYSGRGIPLIEIDFISGFNRTAKAPRF